MSERESDQPKYLEPLEKFRGKTLRDILPQISLTLGGRTSIALTTLEQSLQ